MNKVSFGKINFKLRFGLFSEENNSINGKKENTYTLFPDTPAGDEEFPDILGRDKIAEKVSFAIRKSRGQINFLIAGEWGIGKTTILKKIKSDLNNYGIKTVWFSPWKYSGSKEAANAISKAFLTLLSEGFGKRSEIKELYIKKQIESERNLVSQIITLIPILIRYVLYTSVVFLFFILLKNIFPPFSDFLNKITNSLKFEDRINLLVAASAILALPPLGEYFIAKIRQKGEVEKVSSPELLEKKFKNLISETVSNRTLQVFLSIWEDTFDSTFLWFLGKPLTNKIFYRGLLSFLCIKRLVVFVDDLDRCEEGEVKEFLTGMKTFLDDRKVYYVIAADIDKLRDKTSKEEPEFLRKIVQIDWNVPNLNGKERELFIKNLLQEAGAQEDLIDIKQVAYLFGLTPNPRKIKYFLRRLLFLLNYEESS